MPSCRVPQLKNDLISQKNSHRSTALSKPHRQPLFFDAQGYVIHEDK
jgi:hypothetical protein